jgi:hypothetical protein
VEPKQRVVELEEQVMIFQGMDLLNIVYKLEEVQVEQTGMSNNHQQPQVMEVLVAMVEVVVEHIVDHSMEMTGMVLLIEVKVAVEKVTVHVEEEVMEVQALFK